MELQHVLQGRGVGARPTQLLPARNCLISKRISSSKSGQRPGTGLESEH
jgi:hypothetical protein